MIFLKKCYFNTTKSMDCIPLTHEVHYCIKDAGIQAGIMTVVVPGPGAAVTVGEHIPELVEALVQSYAQLVAAVPDTAKATTTRDGAVALRPRVLSAMYGRSVSLPFEHGRLILDPYSDVLLCDFESAATRREVVMQVIGDAEPTDGRAGPTMGVA